MPRKKDEDGALHFSVGVRCGDTKKAETFCTHKVEAKSSRDTTFWPSPQHIFYCTDLPIQAFMRCGAAVVSSIRSPRPAHAHQNVVKYQVGAPS